MTTDITELAQSLKAAAENAIGAHERLAAYPYGEIIDISQHEGEQIDIDITDINEFHEEASPANILALVEAVEKAQTINAAAEKLVRCKGRYHSELNYRALAALFGITTPDLPPLDGESRTVTIEPFRSFVTDADLAALHRFAECCDDPESGGHDLEKEQVRRLEAIGALQRSGRISYITGFGDVLISITAGIKWEAE